MKKIVSLTLICLMLSAMFIPAAATEKADTSRIIVDGVDITIDIEDEIRRAMSGITDIEVNPDFFSAELIADEDDVCTSVKTYTTTREITLTTNNNAVCMTDTSTESKIYATTCVSVLANEKNDSNSNIKNGVTAYGTIYWRDNFGLHNDLLGISGGWAAEKDPTTGNAPTIYSRDIRVEWYYDAKHRDNKHYTPSSNSFSYSQSQLGNWVGWRFALDTTAKTTKGLEVTLHVETGIFT